MVSTAFHGALEHADLAFVSWGTLRACVVRCLDGLRGWWVGRQTNAQLKDNDCRSKEPIGRGVHEMWIQFHGRTDAHGSKEPIKLNIHSSHKSGILSPGRARASRKFAQLFKVSTRREQSRQGCSHSGKPAARFQASEVSSYHWEFITIDPRENRTDTGALKEPSPSSPPMSPMTVTL